MKAEVKRPNNLSLQVDYHTLVHYPLRSPSPNLLSWSPIPHQRASQPEQIPNIQCWTVLRIASPTQRRPIVACSWEVQFDHPNLDFTDEIFPEQIGSYRRVESSSGWYDDGGSGSRDGEMTFEGGRQLKTANEDKSKSRNPQGFNSRFAMHGFLPLHEFWRAQSSSFCRHPREHHEFKFLHVWWPTRR